MLSTVTTKVFENCWVDTDRSRLDGLARHARHTGSLLYAYLVGGQLNLQPGQILMATDGADYLLLSWLEGLQGMTFTIMGGNEFDEKHSKFKKKNWWIATWNSPSLNVVAVRDEKWVQALHRSPGDYEQQSQPTCRKPPPPPSPSPSPPKVVKPAMRKVKAKYDFVADDANEISFTVGDIMEILQEASHEEWITAGKGDGKECAPDTSVA